MSYDNANEPITRSEETTSTKKETTGVHLDIRLNAVMAPQDPGMSMLYQETVHKSSLSKSNATKKDLPALEKTFFDFLAFLRVQLSDDSS